MKKKVIISVLLVGGMLLLPIGASESLKNESGPEFEIYLGSSIGPSFDYESIQIFVKNIGDAPAHNVTLTDFQINGSVVYNNRGAYWFGKNDFLEPGEIMSGFPKTAMIGFGKFTVEMTITCDEEVNATGTGDGVIFGFIVFIP